MTHETTRRGLTLAWLLCGSLAAGQEAREEAAAPVCRGLTVAAIPPSTSTDRGFSARDVLDLQFRVQLPGQNTPALVEMRYFTPAGHLYQAVQVPVAPESSLEAERALPDHPFPVKVARVEVRAARGKGSDGTDRERFVTMPALPLAGTVIAQSSLHGTWRAEAWPTGAQSPCTLSFRIRP